jgi:acetoin utilization deacetylase AcuC-like enzyme
VTVLSHPVFLEHDTGPGHPESADRLKAVLAALDAAGLPWVHAAGPASDAALLRAHTSAHVAHVLGLAGTSGQAGEETPIGPRSIDAALWAAGAAVEAVDRALAGDPEVWALVRPPGHHATRTRSMGFCVLNNVAVAALHALARGAARVAVLDWDVHHGNGTQDIFWDCADACLVSLHQDPLYPHTGSPEERGAHGNIVNIPLLCGTDDDAYMQALDALALPALERFAPSVLLVSAGFDALQHDPLAGMWVTPAGFGRMTARVRAWARAQGVPLVFVLEGGYRVDALGACVVACVWGGASPIAVASENRVAAR